MESQNLSTKNIYRVFQDIYTNHKGLQSFGTGDIYRVNGRTKLEHPTLWVDLTQANISRNLITIQAQIYVFDVVAQSEFGESDIQSDTLLLINDVITLLRTHYELINDEFDVTTNFFTHSFNDRVAGWVVNVDLEVPMLYGDCDISVENLTGFPPSNDVDPFQPPISEFIMASPSHLWRITINDQGNLQSQRLD